jgi:tryptophan-rich sensory protein
MKKTVSRQQRQTIKRPPLLWTGIIFALAATLLLVTLANSAVAPWQTNGQLILLVTLLAAFIAGGLTAYYTGHRGGMHAFVGSVISIPLLALFIIPGWWQGAILAGAFCTLGGTLAELAIRSRGVRK